MLVSCSSKFCSTRLVIERSSAMPPPISSTAIQPEAISTMRRARLTCARTDSTARSEEHTSELQSLMRISYAVFCLKKKHKCDCDEIRRVISLEDVYRIIIITNTRLVYSQLFT